MLLLRPCELFLLLLFLFSQSSRFRVIQQRLPPPPRCPRQGSGHSVALWRTAQISRRLCLLNPAARYKLLLAGRRPPLGNSAFPAWFRAQYLLIKSSDRPASAIQLRSLAAALVLFDTGSVATFRLRTRTCFLLGGRRLWAANRWGFRCLQTFHSPRIQRALTIGPMR